MDFMAFEYCLSSTDKDAILEHLKQVNMVHAVCSACASEVDLSFMRKRADDPVLHAMCVPCFLRNNSDTEQYTIDKLVKLAERLGWYF